MFGLVPRRRVGWGLSNIREELFRDIQDLSNFTGTWGFNVDVKDENDHYLLQAEMPGVDKEKIQLDLKNSYLMISMTNNEETNQEESNYIRRERRMSSCRRNFYVGDVKPEQIVAQYKDGILEIKVPKADDAKVQSGRIPIN